MTCQHEKLFSVVFVHRLTETEEADAPVIGYTADISIKCSACGKPFQFLGLPPGSQWDAPTCSIDALEARMPICPAGEQPSPLTVIKGKLDS